jgi:hypothetical protein
MHVTVPWFVAFLLFAGAFVVWVIRDRRWQLDRNDDAADRLDQRMEHVEGRAGALEDRVDVTERWLWYLDDRTGPPSDPRTEPIPLPDDDGGPPTLPGDFVLVREWSKDIAGPVEAWPRCDPESYGRHALPVRVDAEPRVTGHGTVVVPVGSAGEEPGRPATTTEGEV